MLARFACIFAGVALVTGLVSMNDENSKKLSIVLKISLAICAISCSRLISTDLLNKLVDKYEGSEWIFLTIVMILFAVITSVSGLSLGLFFLFPFVITTILLMGYSKITALLTTVGSVCIGLIGTSYSLTEMATVNEYLGLSAASELIVKLVMLVVGLILLIVNTLLYARKHRINSPRKGFLYPETTNEKAKTWPITFVFDAVLVVMILSFVSWTSAFEITFFEDLLTNINEFKIGESTNNII